MKKQDRFCRVPCTEAMIPVVDRGNEPEYIRVLVDNRPAICFISNPIVSSESNGSMKIVIIFDEKHPSHGDSFYTKHFVFAEPGKMQWGHNGEHMTILC